MTEIHYFVSAQRKYIQPLDFRTRKNVLLATETCTYSAFLLQKRKRKCMISSCDIILKWTRYLTESQCKLVYISSLLEDRKKVRCEIQPAGHKGRKLNLSKRLAEIHKNNFYITLNDLTLQKHCLVNGSHDLFTLPRGSQPHSYSKIKHVSNFIFYKL
mgnify:CR=1 FL=1